MSEDRDVKTRLQRLRRQTPHTPPQTPSLKSNNRPKVAEIRRFQASTFGTRLPRNKSGGPGRTRTCNQTVMSGKLSDFPNVSERWRTL